ncbi:MAG: MmcQ/YjbR family DNA-binding protein [Nitriliruptorales bacterium]|nr:MmcQ/YjbR family DNA-binding protein [Nitriliruptorales bacterium]
MQPTPRNQLPYTDADVSAATDRLREICAALPEVSERLSHGAVTFFIRSKKTLCYLTDDHHGDGRLALVCPARSGVQEEMIESDPARFFRPPYVGHRGWIGLRIDIDPDWDEVAGMIEEAYRCVAPVTLVRRIDEQRDRSDEAS